MNLKKENHTETILSTISAIDDNIHKIQQTLANMSVEECKDVLYDIKNNKDFYNFDIMINKINRVLNWIQVNADLVHFIRTVPRTSRRIQIERALHRNIIYKF